MTRRINNEVFADYLKCQYKAYLKIKGRRGQKTEYEEMQNRLLQEYRTKVRKHLLLSKYKNETFLSKITLSRLHEQPCRIGTNVTAIPHRLTVIFDAVIFASSANPPQYIPVSFVHRNSVSKDDRLVLAFWGLLLGEELDTSPMFAKIIYGSQYAIRKVQLAKLADSAEEILRGLQEIKHGKRVPPLTRNLL